jgi:hypothetical protein
MNRFKTTYKIYLDDVRVPKMSAKYFPELSSLYLSDDWVIVRSYKEFVDVVKERFEKEEWPIFVSFDHDLADEHTQFFYDNGGWTSPPNPDYSSFKELTGLSAAKWMCDFMLDNSLPFPGYAVHSANPVGRENIQGYLANFKKFYGKAD